MFQKFNSLASLGKSYQMGKLGSTVINFRIFGLAFLLLISVEPFLRKSRISSKMDFLKRGFKDVSSIIPHSCRIYYVAKSGIILVIVTHFV